MFSECRHFESEINQILRILCQKDIFYREQEVTRSKIYSNHGTGQLLNLKNLNLAARKCGRCGRRWLCHCEESLIGGRRRGKKRESGTTKTDHNVTNCTEKNIFLFLNCLVVFEHHDAATFFQPLSLLSYHLVSSHTVRAPLFTKKAKTRPATLPSL